MSKLLLFFLLIILLVCACSTKKQVILPTATPELLIAPKPTATRLSVEEQSRKNWEALYATAQAEAMMKTSTAEAVYWQTPHTPKNIYSPTPETKQSCRIKGNPDTMIYHCKNSPNFDTMTNYKCFGSPAEAEAAGYRMSKNVGWCQY